MITLPRAKTEKKKRKGRGYGSGKGGHTSGRGQKGQKSRGSVGILFEGMKMRKSLIKRLPLKRGKDKFSARPKPLVVKLELLNLLPTGSIVDKASLVKYKVIDAKSADKNGVKILGGGKLEKKFTIKLPISNSAAKQVEKAGGKVDKKDQEA
jgi:large subunit ribosomal protein L15